MIADYHLHTSFSFDSTEQMENICEKAIEAGIEEVCFTDHVEFTTENENKWPDFLVRNNKIEECREKYGKQLSVLNGIEVGQPHRELQQQKQLLTDFEFDFIIASVHVITNIGSPSKYSFTKGNCIDFVDHYFDDLKKVAKQSDFDVLGHMTFPFRYVPQELLEIYPIHSFKREFMEIFEIIVERGKGIEINTSGLRTVLKETIPNQQVVKWYKECGGKIITVGSDGHSSKSAFSGLEIGYQILKNAGFEEIARYKKRHLSFEKLL